MQLHVAFDDRGTIVAAAEAGREGDRIEPLPGQRVADLEVPAQFADKAPGEFVHLLEVDPATTRLRVRERPPK